MKILENFVENNLKMKEELEAEAFKGISNLPEAQRAVMIDCLNRAKKGKITVDELLKIRNQWE